MNPLWNAVVQGLSQFKTDGKTMAYKGIQQWSYQ
jgi:hypothetical protein